MKKRVLAIVMSVAMVVAFMPVFAFADASNYDDPAARDAEVSSVNAEILDYIANLDLSEYNETIDDIQALVNAILDAVQTGDTETIAKLGAELDPYIQELNKYLDAFYGENEGDIQKAMKDLEEACKTLDDLCAYLDTGEMTPELEAQINDAVEAVKAALADLEEAFGDEIAALLKDATDALKALLEEYGSDYLDADTMAFIEDLLEQASTVDGLIALAEEYLTEENLAAAQEAIEALIADAQGALDEAVAYLENEVLPAVIDQVLEAWENGEFDEYLAQAGIDREELERFVEDVMAYIEGYANGDSYLALKEQIAILEDALAAMEDQKAADDELIKQLKNALALTAAKPAVSKAKGKKKKMIVTYKPLDPAAAEATGYEISYKKGKKTKTYEVTDLSQTKVKIKAKKGKYKVKVRAAYQGSLLDQVYYSKWSKAKKVKVK